MKGVKKGVKFNLKTTHTFLKGQKKSKTKVDLIHLKEQHEVYKGNCDSSPTYPNVDKVPLKEDDQKSWLEFKKLDEGRPVYEIVSSELNEEGRWSIPLDHPFIPVITKFAISAFNEVRQKVIEEGILGVYKVIVGCGVRDGSTTLIHFILTDRRPTGKIAMMLPHLISQKYRYKTMKAMKKDLEVIISETTEKSTKDKYKRKVADELIRLEKQHKAMKGICKMLYRQIRLQIPKTWNDRNDDDPDDKPVRNSGLYPRSKLATCKGYDYYTNYSDFCIFSVYR